MKLLARLLFSSALVASVATPLLAQDPSSVSITLNTQSPGKTIAPDFSGFSYEVIRLLPDANGVYYFRPDNQPLLALFRTLNIKNLRIGGNTSDRDAKELPNEAGIDNLFQFAKAAGVKVIYGLRLLNGDAQESAKIVKYITTRYPDLIECFAIGQEASAYPVEKVDTRANSERMGAEAEKYRYEDYKEAWTKFADVILAAVPEARLSGPGVHRHGEWTSRFINDFAGTNNITLVTAHLYPGGAGNKVPSPEVGRARMLSEDFTQTYQKLHDGFVPLSGAKSLPYRLDETNNYFNGGALDVSNTFAAALWSLDYMHWWASHGAVGVNFHTGDTVAAGSSLLPAKYAAFVTAPGGYSIRPLSYGMLAFALGGSGRYVPVTVSPGEPNLSAYAVVGEDGSSCVTLINKTYGESARSLKVTLNADALATSGQILFLTVPKGDVAATDGITLGGTGIKNAGTWAGAWEPVSPPVKGVFNLALPPATAAVLKIPAPRR